MQENDKESIIQQLLVRIQQHFPDDGSGHDLGHIRRVFTLAGYLAKQEKADGFLVALAALLHDVGDYKLHPAGIENHREAILYFCRGLDLNESTIEQVIHIVEHVSFKGAAVADVPLGIEGQCVRDADRLDAIGAVGVVRAFAYGALHQRPMYDESFLPQRHQDFEAYKTSKGPTIHHFFEKLLLIHQRLETKTAKALAVSRHQFLLQFIEQFQIEIENKDFTQLKD